MFWAAATPKYVVGALLDNSPVWAIPGAAPPVVVFEPMDWTGWFLPRARRRPPAESLTPPAEADLQQLAALRAAGSRLHLPHPVRCFLRFESEAAARRFMEALSGEAAVAQLRATGDGGWIVTTVQTIVPTPGAVTRVRETLSALAATESGRFLSWTAPAVY